MSKKRKKYCSEFNAKIALAEVKNSEATISEMVAQFGVYPNIIVKWQCNLVEEASDIFD